MGRYQLGNNRDDSSKWTQVDSRMQPSLKAEDGVSRIFPGRRYPSLTLRRRTQTCSRISIRRALRSIQARPERRSQTA